MSNILNVAALSLDIANSDKAENIRRLKKAVEALPMEVDVAVIPEMFSTGFICKHAEATSLAESDCGDTLNAVRDLVKERNIAICGSYISRSNSKLYNRAFFIAPDATEHFYNKYHLFSPGGEDRVYTRGDALPPVFEYKGWRIAMAVCFDLRFPTWLRNRSGNQRYDLLIIMANWPDSRAFAWSQLLIARAIENQAYIVGVNRTGVDDFGTYSGTSAIIDAKGAYMHGDDFAALSLDSLNRFREKFPILDEADSCDIAVNK